MSRPFEHFGGAAGEITLEDTTVTVTVADRRLGVPALLRNLVRFLLERGLRFRNLGFCGHGLM